MNPHDDQIDLQDDHITTNPPGEWRGACEVATPITAWVPRCLAGHVNSVSMFIYHMIHIDICWMYIYDVSTVTYQMKPFSVTLLATDTVSRLGHWMPGKIEINNQTMTKILFVKVKVLSHLKCDFPLWKVKVMFIYEKWKWLSPIKSESDCHLWKVKTQSSFTKMLRLRSLLFHACLACSSLNINILIWTMNDSGDGLIIT